MPDHAVSSSPAVQAQLDRLWSLSPGADVLGLDRITRLLDRLGNPQRNLPPVFHVAGTNGKGSTCAFLRAAIEAAEKRVHVYSSPHLVRFNERIRLAGELIDDAHLAALLEEVLDHADGLRASFFEVTTAAAFLAFARTPADACVIEVGLGGRLDATNVIARPAVTGIAALGIDHQAFLGETLPVIAAEKAGIAKEGVPLVTLAYPPEIAAVIDRIATERRAPVVMQGRDWTWTGEDGVVRYHDAKVAIAMPIPTLAGDHQRDNLALAAAMIRNQSALRMPEESMAEASRQATWPARMQRLDRGDLVDSLPAHCALWLDGAHNPSAAARVADAFIEAAPRGPRILILGMLANKDAAGVLGAFAPVVDLVVAVPVPGHDEHDPQALADQARGMGLNAEAAGDIAAALRLASTAQSNVAAILIAGSLYLAGEALKLNGTPPD
ncbi:Bifunctional folylpolyglutamate synthase/dihydrofolate synthase [Sphingomonas sp. EC-HK361]|uniref:bifunctional folylpolyglutamate synthase/dihydrofolate synthase n=1 Tax=Sphingomonas sp. EC-HK361 TaxID=2038397 RepID=UPI001250EE77|nr:folylpolyglutamate synthase/dihydrofolate synthase family protein [Sphingomonas sp. EC-HK361]VVT10667.1 Bifunctional folylpolyglutamate synthase/dihydrofolate synthase [Sphingomonas sp. EC-HK361]